MGMSGNKKGGFSEINVTPLVDVMLVLLIIFMVTAPMIQQGEEINLPKTTSTNIATDQDTPFELIINPKGQIFFGKTEIPMGLLQEKIASNALLQKKGEIFIRGDASVPYGDVLKVISLVRRGGITKVGLITEPEK